MIRYNVVTLLLLVCAVSARAYDSRYEAQGNVAQPGWYVFVTYNAAAYVAGQDPATGILRVGVSVGAKISTGGISARVISRDLNGGDIKIPDLNGEIFVLPGNRDFQVQIRDGTVTGSGDWVPILESTKIVTLGTPKKATIKTPVANADLKWTFYDAVTGKKLGEYTVLAGQSETIGVGISNGNDVSYIASTIGGYWDETTQMFISDPNTVSMVKSGMILNSQMQSQSAPSNSSSQIQPGVTGTIANSGSVGANVEGSLMDQGDGNAATNATMTRGFNNVVNGLAAINSTLKNNKLQTTSTGGGGGATVDLTGTNSRIDTTNTRLTSIRDGVDALNGKLLPIQNAIESMKTTDDKWAAMLTVVQTAKDNAPTISQMQGSGAQAKTETVGLFLDKGSLATGKGYTPTPSGAPTLAVTLPATFGGKTFDMNPFSNDRFSAVCAWFRSATAWAVLAVFGAWVWTQVGPWARGMSSVRQARGNTYLGTGGQATAFIAATLMTTAIITGLAALMSWSFDEISFPSLVSNMTTNPLATIPAGVYWMIDQLFPVATMITCLVGRLAFNAYAASVYAGCAAVVRFIVP